MASNNTTEIAGQIESGKNDAKAAPKESPQELSKSTAAAAPLVKENVKNDAHDGKRSAEKQAGSEAKRARSSSEAQEDSAGNKKKTFVDMAEELGFHAGDRLEVQWELEQNGKTVIRNWGATLLEHDGKSHKEGFAIRKLKYDPYPEGGYPEYSIEPAVFVTQSILVNPNSDEQLSFKREGEGGTIYCLHRLW